MSSRVCVGGPGVGVGGMSDIPGRSQVHRELWGGTEQGSGPLDLP